MHILGVGELHAGHPCPPTSECMDTLKMMFFQFARVHENLSAIYYIEYFTDAPSSKLLRLRFPFDIVSILCLRFPFDIGVRRSTVAAEDSQPLAPVPDHADNSRGMSFCTVHLCS